MINRNSLVYNSSTLHMQKTQQIKAANSNKAKYFFLKNMVFTFSTDWRWVVWVCG
jgi:hypothetical protein